MKYYDNHANQIDYFNSSKPKIVVKRKNIDPIDLNDLSDDQLAQKLDEAEFRKIELTELYKDTGHDSAFEMLSKLHGFMSVVHAHIRRRKLETNQSLRLQVEKLKQQLSATDKTSINEKLVKENKRLGLKLAELQDLAKKNKEAEKTKRHEINVKNKKPKFEYLKEYLKNTIPEDEYALVLDDLNEIDKRNLNQ